VDSVGGILMSTTAASGLRADTFRTSSSASPARATTSKPASPGTRTIPSRKARAHEFEVGFVASSNLHMHHDIAVSRATTTS
jgi:hypothetical protein